MTNEELKGLLTWAQNGDDVRLLHTTRAALLGDQEAQRSCSDQAQMLHLMGVVWR